MKTNYFKNYTYLLAIAFCLFLASCKEQKADLIVYNGLIYTVNQNFDTAQAMAIKDGKIIAVGTNESIRDSYKATEELDAKGKAIYPGFIDAHAHFFGYGQSLQSADLRETQSWEEVISRLVEFAKTHPDGWLSGRGWDQNDWPNKQFPSKKS